MGATGGGIWGMAPAYLTERFPTAVRGVGPGLSYHVGAAVGSATPFVLGQLQDGGMTTGGAMMSCIVAGGLLVAAVVWLGPETRGRRFQRRRRGGNGQAARGEAPRWTASGGRQRTAECASRLKGARRRAEGRPYLTRREEGACRAYRNRGLQAVRPNKAVWRATSLPRMRRELRDGLPGPREGRGADMRRQGWLVGAMLAASLVGGAVSNLVLTARLGAQGAQVVTASQVNIVDGAGRLRAILSGDDERGMASLAFYAPDGAFRGLVGVDADGHPVLRFTDPGGRTRILATVRQEDGMVTVGDEAARHALIGAQAGTPFVGLSDGRRIPMQFTLGDRGQPRVNLFNSRGQPGIGMVVGADDAPFLSVFDPAGCAANRAGDRAGLDRGQPHGRRPGAAGAGGRRERPGHRRLLRRRG